MANIPCNYDEVIFVLFTVSKQADVIYVAVYV